jgi:murein DD-endopeptidase MepM/ murein hydrolase activator NlpD
VTTATWDGAAGNYVSINHGDGFSSSYLHMTHYIVSPGQYVEQGQIIGYVGSTGASTGPHLHFAIYYKGASQNPAAYMNF